MVWFLESRPIVIPQEEARSIPVLLSDSKGARLEQAHENNLPLVFLCKRGASTKHLVDLLLQKLPLLLQVYKKVITVYFWGGTCDITKKQGKCIQIRGKATDIISAIVEELHRAKDFVLSQNCRIKFIGVPFYLISLYNDVKGHRNPTVFLDSDTEVVDLLNQHIEQINLQLGRNTLKFNADLRDTRRGKKRYFFKLLPDGLHPGCLLAQKWLRRLELDIVRECYPPKDTVEVEEQEFLAFQQN